MNQPMCRVVALQYYSKGPTVDVLRVHFRTHMDTMEYHDLPNNNYSVQCPALQFMALYNFPPTSIEGTKMNVEDAQLLLPIVPNGENWALGGTVLDGGEDVLREAEWFEGVDIVGEEETQQQRPQGGSGDPDGGTGVTVEVEGEDSDRGVTVTVD